MRQDIKKHLDSHSVPYEEMLDIREVAGEADVIYNTRIQEERGGYLSNYGPPANRTVNAELMKIVKKDAIIMHPLPRKDEINPEIDSDPRAAYFRQADNGLPVKMAILKMLFT